MNAIELVGQASGEQIEKWKKEHKDGIYAIEADGHVGYFRNPCRGDVNAAVAAYDADRGLATSEKFAELTFIGGSEELLQNDTLFLGIVGDLKNKMNGARTKLVNL